MNRILEIDLENERAVLQPGVVNLDITLAVQGQKYFYAPDPSSQRACTIGGNVAENAGGPHTLAYGVTTTRDPQTSTPDVFAYADMIDAGMMPGPRVFATGPGVFSSSGIDDRDAAFRFIKR